MSSPRRAPGNRELRFSRPPWAKPRKPAVPQAPPGTPETLAGLIERVTYFNEENGFAVLKVKAKGFRDFVTVVGNLPSVSAGEWIHAEGLWVQDREHGQQLKATLLTSTPPTTLEGIEKYLGSGMVKGIGPVYAKKLVGKFADRIFDVIENNSARLEEIEGIGPKRRHRIKDAWAEQKVVRGIMVFLHSHGVGTSRAVRIHKTYGNEAIEKVRTNPYILARDIPGIGFKTADEIARKCGIPFDSLERVSAGLSYVLQQASGEGHCALPVELLKEEAGKLLAVPETIINQALERTVQHQEVVLDPIDGQTLAFLPHLKNAEEGIAARLGGLLRGTPGYPAINLTKAVPWCETRTGKTLAPSQRDALSKALTHRLVVITGGPGVGKTTLLQTILMVLEAKKVRCLLCAPTGRAAKRLSEATGLSACTIHRLLEAQGGSGRFQRNEASPLDCDLLVVDEASMVDIPLMHHVLRALPPRASLLLVGDADQLPSVGPGAVLRDLIQSGVIPVVHLTEVFRQAAESRIITTAHAVNEGRFPPPPPAGQESDFYFLERQEPPEIVSGLVDLVQRRLPAKYRLDPMRDIQVLCPMNRGSLGVRELNVALQNALNPDRDGLASVSRFGWHFRKGDRVMQVENNYDKEVFNGDIGRIVDVDEVEQEITVEFDGRKVLYEFGELDELVLAYAVTIHKSQGSEFPAVVMPLAMQQYLLLQRNLIYTGITRGRKLVVLIGQKRALAMAVRNDKTERRFSGLLHRLRQLAISRAAD